MPQIEDSKKPFQIVIVGDFSGRFSHPPGTPKLVPQLVDRDNFDDVLEGMNVSLTVHGEKLSFYELDDFHPDKIYQALRGFEDLDRHMQKAVAPTPAPAPADLLSMMIAEHGDEPSKPVSVSDAEDLASFVRRISAGHTVPLKDPTKQKQALQRQALATEMLRGVLHDPHLQAIEAAWRALYMLVRGIDTGEDLKIYIVDLTLPELVTHMDALREALQKKGSWAVIAGNYAFGQSDTEIKVLGRLAGLAALLQAPFLAEAVPAEEGAASEAWMLLRKSPEAKWIGLALPRFLLRLPYGKKTSPIESFPFEEMEGSEHADYLWGNPAFFCAYLLAQAFEQSGWEMSRIPRRIDGLPLHIYKDEDGLSAAKPCAEILMTERSAEDLMAAGFMPLASLKEQDAALLVRFQSIAEPVQSLPGFGPTAV